MRASVVPEPRLSRGVRAAALASESVPAARGSARATVPGTVFLVFGLLATVVAVVEVGVLFGTHASAFAPAMFLLTLAGMVVGASAIVAGWALLRGFAFGGPASRSVTVFAESLGLYLILLFGLLGTLSGVSHSLAILSAPAMGLVALVAAPSATPEARARRAPRPTA